MANIFVVFFVSMICISLKTAFAAPFECSDEPAACKTKFGQQFEKDFKELHVEATRILLTTYIDTVNTIKGELSADDPYITLINDSIDKFSKNLRRLNANVSDNINIGDIIEEAMRNMGWDLQGYSNFHRLVRKYNAHEHLANVMRKFATDLGNLWAEMYTGLKEADLKTYPEYADVNRHMESLRGNGETRPSSRDFTLAVEILATKFHLPYFQSIADIA